LSLVSDGFSFFGGMPDIPAAGAGRGILISVSFSGRIRAGIMGEKPGCLPAGPREYYSVKGSFLK
jgi:hypothetical protein